MSTDGDRFSSDEIRALNAVLDEIVPPSADGKLPGAGEVGVADYIQTHTLRQSPELEPLIKQGLATLDAIARRREPRGFCALSPVPRAEALAELESSSPGFVSSLIFPTYLGYYQHPRVLAALGLGTNPPHPTGYQMEPNDLKLLDAVRRRAKFFRDC
jgi:hypothetical protein